MKLWDNDLRNVYKKPELHAYYWCVDFCWKAIEKAVDNVKSAANTAGAAAGAITGKVTKPIAQGIENAGNAFGNAMQTVGDATGVSGLVNTIGEKTGLKELGQNIHAGFQYGAGLVPEQSSSNSGMVDGDEDKGAQTKAQTDEAATAAAGAGATSEREAANSARESGVNASRAGNMAGANNSSSALTSGLYQAGAAQNAATQADYRNKMAQADIMDTQANNMAKGAKLMPWAAGLQGFGQGMQLGGLMSDENCKEAPADGIDDQKLIEAMEQFKSLYNKLQELKK